MTTKRILASAFAASAAMIAIAAPAQAQVSGIATANPVAVVAKAKAFGAARQQIETTYKTAFDQIQARRTAMQKETEPLIAQLRTQFDTNKDGQLSQAEQTAMQNAKSPALDKLRAAQEAAETEIGRLSNPAARAELFAIESILRQYEAAQLKVVNARKIAVVLQPEVIMYAPDSADVSDAITAEIDKVSPTVSIQPPADWQPSRETMQIQQQLVQIAQLQAYRAAAQRQGAQAPAAGTAPATAPKPAEPR